MARTSLAKKILLHSQLPSEAQAGAYFHLLHFDFERASSKSLVSGTYAITIGRIRSAKPIPTRFGSRNGNLDGMCERGAQPTKQGQPELRVKTREPQLDIPINSTEWESM